ncbi:Meiotically up-regulated gene 89 protein [Zancudomyces culisetae]|uniref:Meiotically up-regulated gene 89 protein n=1 Tax=Zancudomyces culisetae TaxID=1213189 RepID=A0A1R1PT41_ZANCU|nr:Meiotically up-regulated gene 89 protein [Zancudomyces culisetae]OMH84166.1 Meiotically up-regulated gene 89 protein [Zancudomyces culisetae]|eukprot:OMH78619.1 Meiotically up-regulated gene 89 protein [Zancudomyces culisetae]
MYAKSYNTDQLKGEALTISQLAGGDCEPLASRTINNQTKPIYPCGLIANSLFNDTFSSPILTNPKGQDSSAEYKMSSTGITWSYDKDRYGKTSYKNTDVFPPPFWDARYPNGYNSTNSIPDLSQDENFMVWMRPAAFPSFLKLYSRNDVDTMETGVYQINIEMNFDTIPIKAEKFLVLSSSNFLGGRNPNLGITYFAFSGICILLGILFIVRHLYRPRRLGDHSYLSWNQQIQSGLVNNIVS